MKYHVLLIIIICLFSCTTRPTAVRKWFPNTPDGIANCGAIYDYMQNFSTGDINIARNEYFTVLSFIEETINASYENLERAYRLDTPTVKRPALENGRLIIIESTEMVDVVKMWGDIDVRERYKIVAIVNVPWEFALIIHHSIQYNDLLDYWHSLTGELLGEHKDIIAIHDKLLQDIGPLLNPGSRYCGTVILNE